MWISGDARSVKSYSKEYPFDNRHKLGSVQVEVDSLYLRHVLKLAVAL
jgi:hypothetical protein